MQWPRTGVRKPDTYVNTYATGFPFRISEDYFSETEIPDQVKRAQVVLAVYLNNNKDGIGLSGLEDFKNVQEENTKFSEKGVKAAGTRARKALLEIAKATKERRKEIQDAKTSA